MKISEKIMPFCFLFAMLFLASFTHADKEMERVLKATAVVENFGKMKENFPSKLMDQAQGIVIIPKMINAGLGVGAKRGKGLAMVKLSSGEWSNPVFVTITGGSFGFQAGVQAVDLVLVFQNKEALSGAKNGSFTIGGDVSAAAGPIGRNSSAGIDYQMDSGVYSYSSSKGMFAGVSINGANLAYDKQAIENFYGSATTSADLFANSNYISDIVRNLIRAL